MRISFFSFLPFIFDILFVIPGHHFEMFSCWRVMVRSIWRRSCSVGPGSFPCRWPPRWCPRPSSSRNTPPWPLADVNNVDVGPAMVLAIRAMIPTCPCLDGDDADLRTLFCRFPCHIPPDYIFSFLGRSIIELSGRPSSKIGTPAVLLFWTNLV